MNQLPDQTVLRLKELIDQKIILEELISIIEESKNNFRQKILNLSKDYQKAESELDKRRLIRAKYQTLDQFKSLMQKIIAEADQTSIKGAI